MVMSRQLAFSGDINRCSFIVRETVDSGRESCPGSLTGQNPDDKCGCYMLWTIQLLCPIFSMVLRPVVDERVVPSIQWQAPYCGEIY